MVVAPAAAAESLTAVVVDSIALEVVVVETGMTEVLGKSNLGTLAVALYAASSDASASESKVALYWADHPASQQEPYIYRNGK